MHCSKLVAVVNLAEYILWGWYGINKLFLNREMSIKIFIKDFKANPLS